MTSTPLCVARSHGRSKRDTVALRVLRGAVTTLIATLTALLLTPLTYAHSSLVRTTPANDAVLTESPPLIELEFREPTRLTSVVVIEPGKKERTLAFSPTGSAAVFTISQPQLATGRNEIRWKALSRDGHVVSGVLIFTIEPTR